MRPRKWKGRWPRGCCGPACGARRWGSPRGGHHPDRRRRVSVFQSGAGEGRGGTPGGRGFESQDPRPQTPQSSMRPTPGRHWPLNTPKDPVAERVHPKGATTSRHIQHSPGTPTTGLHERGNDTSRSTGRSGRQNAATRRNMRREDRVTVQGPVKKQQPDGMSHRGGGGGRRWLTTREQHHIRHRLPCVRLRRVQVLKGVCDGVSLSAGLSHGG